MKICGYFCSLWLEVMRAFLLLFCHLLSGFSLSRYKTWFLPILVKSSTPGVKNGSKRKSLMPYERRKRISRAPLFSVLAKKKEDCHLSSSFFFHSLLSCLLFQHDSGRDLTVKCLGRERASHFSPLFFSSSDNNCSNICRRQTSPHFRVRFFLTSMQILIYSQCNFFQSFSLTSLQFCQSLSRDTTGHSFFLSFDSK